MTNGVSTLGHRIKHLTVSWHLKHSTAANAFLSALDERLHDSRDRAGVERCYALNKRS